MCGIDSIRREVVRIGIERIQGIRFRGAKERKRPEPEKPSPKTVYEVEEMLNNPYMNRDEIPLAMDIFKPVVPEETELPVIVYIHGGGLVMGDRTMARDYGRALASRGYLVFSIEYRLAPRANACEQLDDVCAGMDYIGRRLVDFNVDFWRTFLTAESAGAFLAIYVAAMKRSVKLQEAIGYEPTRMSFKALGLHGGMFYTDRDDPIGWMLEDQFFGEKIADDNFMQYLDPEHEEIIKNLPPVFLTTSRGDFLNNYTLMYHDAIKKAGRPSHLMYFGDEDLGHAFAAMEPFRAASIDALDRMTDYFEESVDRYKQTLKRINKEQKELIEIENRTESGKIIEQKSWKFIKELNSYSKDRLDSIALKDCKREYTYRQMFRMWESYAEVFSALGITGKNKSRVGMIGSAANETIIAFYALNMTGTSVSMVHRSGIRSIDKWKQVIEKEGITDLLLNDVMVGPRIVKKLIDAKEELGLRNIIMLHVPVSGKGEDRDKKYIQKEHRREFKKTKGLLMMEKLLKEYEAYPIAYSDKQDEAAVIIHTSGTTSGISKPVPLSDRGLNEAVARLLRDERFKSLRGRAVTVNNGDMMMSYTMIDKIHLPLAFGGRIVNVLEELRSTKVLKDVAEYKANVIFTAGRLMDDLMRMPVKADLSSVEIIFLGGNYVSAEAKKRYKEYFDKNGWKAEIYLGYGLSEAGAACILASPEREDDSIGYPLPGVKVKIRDEKDGSFHDISEGPRTGVMYLSSPSVSSGRLGDMVLFEPEKVDGDKYLNTYDLVTAGEDGSLYYAGRVDKYFVNNEDVRFESGLLETALSKEEGITACGVAPVFNKVIYDTVPVLYVETKKRGPEAVEAVRKALYNVYVRDDLDSKSSLPSGCVITKEIPFNAAGKVDVSRILKEEVKGRRLVISPVRRDGKLRDVLLAPAGAADNQLMFTVPDEFKKDARDHLRTIAGTALDGGCAEGGPLEDVFKWIEETFFE